MEEWGTQRAQAPSTEGSYAQDQIVAGFMAKVFWWMSVGLALTAATAFLVTQSAALQQFIFGSQITFYVLIGGELLLVMALTAMLDRLSPAAAIIGFCAYAALNGLTMSVIFFVYTASSIASTFVITSGMFGAMAMYGYVTKRDLSGWSSFLMMGLFGVIIASIVNIFMKSDAMSWIISLAGVVVFTGLTAYDTQKLRDVAASGAGTSQWAVRGALHLYLDFINLFLMLLRLLGSRRD